MSKVRRVIFVLGMLFILMGFMASPSYAQIANPDNIALLHWYVFRDVLETGDQLYFCEYDVGYTTEPDEPADETFMFSIYDTAGTSLLFSRDLNYYQHNIISVYLTPAQALTWEDPYIIRVMGNPSLFSLQEDVNMDTRTLAVGDYREATDLGERMLYVAAILEDSWSIDLLTTSGILNTTGSLYFRRAVPGLNSMAPDIFSESTAYFTVTNPTGNYTYQERIISRRGSSINETLNDLGDWLNISPAWVGFGLTGFAMVMAAGSTYPFTKQPVYGMVMAAIAFICCAWIGFISLQTLFTVMLILAVLFAITFIMYRFA